MDTNAEMSVLGAMLLSRTAIEDALQAGLEPHWFYAPKHELICDAIYTMHTKGAMVNPITLGAELTLRKELTKVGDTPYLFTLQGAPATTAQTPYYVELVKHAYIKRELARQAASLQNALTVTAPEDLAELLDKFAKEGTAVRALLNGTPKRAARRLKVTLASDIEECPTRWLWDTTPTGQPATSHGRIPLHTLAIAGGAPGLGKSQFAVWLTARVTTGTLPGELFGSPRCVIYAATEDSWKMTIKPRLVAAGADCTRVLRIDVEADNDEHAQLTLPTDITQLGELASEYSVGLVVADPLLSFIDDKINDYRAAEVRKALEPLAKAADEHGFTVLGLAHFTKSGAADPLARFAGSGAFGQIVRSALAFAQHDTDEGDTEFVMSLVKNNLGRLDLPSHAYVIQAATVDTRTGPAYVSRFVLGEESTTSVREVMRQETMPGERESTSEIVGWLQNYLTDVGGSAAGNEIKTAGNKQGYSNSTIDRARVKLGLKTERTGFGKDLTTVWYLPEAYAHRSQWATKSADAPVFSPPLTHTDKTGVNGKTGADLHLLKLPV